MDKQELKRELKVLFDEILEQFEEAEKERILSKYAVTGHHLENLEEQLRNYRIRFGDLMFEWLKLRH